MSFEDIIKSGINMPPIYTVKLILNKRTEIKNVSGRIITFKEMELDNKTENISQYPIKIERELKGGNIVITDMLPYLMDNSIHKGIFNGNNSLTIEDNLERLFITLKAIKNPTSLKYATITFDKATKF